MDPRVLVMEVKWALPLEAFVPDGGRAGPAAAENNGACHREATRSPVREMSRRQWLLKLFQRHQ